MNITRILKIRVGRFQVIGHDSVTDRYYAGHGDPTLWTREESVYKHFALTKELKRDLQKAFYKAKRKHYATMGQTYSGDRTVGDIGSSEGSNVATLSDFTEGASNRGEAGSSL